MVRGQRPGRRRRVAGYRRRAAVRGCLAGRPGRAPGRSRRAAPTIAAVPNRSARSKCWRRKPSTISRRRARASSPSSRPTGTTPNWRRYRACCPRSPARCACWNCRSRPTTCMGVRQYVAVELIGKRRVPGGQQLDTLADAMASLEYYLEALRERRPNRDEILDITRTQPGEPALLAAAGRTRRLAVAPVRWPPNRNRPRWRCEDAELASDGASTEPSTAELSNRITATDRRRGVRRCRRPAATIATPVRSSRRTPKRCEALEVEAAAAGKLDAEAAALAETAEDADARTSTTVPCDARRAVDESPLRLPPLPRAPRARVDSNLAANDIDDDIREVFLEEFDEEIVNLNQLLPAWSSRARQPRAPAFHPPRVPYAEGQRPPGGRQAAGRIQLEDREHAQPRARRLAPPSDAVIALLEHSTQVLPQLNAALRGQGTRDCRPGRPAGAQPIAWPRAKRRSTQHLRGRDEDSGRRRVGDAQTTADIEDVPAVFEPETEGTPGVGGWRCCARSWKPKSAPTWKPSMPGWRRRRSTPRPGRRRPAARIPHHEWRVRDGGRAGNHRRHRRRRAVRQAPGSAGETPSAEGVAALADSAQAIRRSIAALQAPSPRIPVFAALAGAAGRAARQPAGGPWSTADHRRRLRAGHLCRNDARHRAAGFAGRRRVVRARPVRVLRP